MEGKLKKTRGCICWCMPGTEPGIRRALNTLTQWIQITLTDQFPALSDTTGQAILGGLSLTLTVDQLG